MRHPTFLSASVLLSVFLSFGLVSCKSRWHCKGPFELSGCIRHVIIDPGDVDRLYAAAENGGVWCLDGAGSDSSRWAPMSDELDNLQMRGVAKSAIDSDYLAVANGLGFVYHTTDHGRSWSRILETSFEYVRTLSLSEGLTRVEAGNYSRLAKETNVWVAAKTGYHRVRLINEQFDSVTQMFPNDPAHASDVLDAVRNPANTDMHFVAVRNQGIWRSKDNGTSWEPVAPWTDFGDAGSPMIKLAVSSDGRSIVAKFGRKIIVSDKGGDIDSWLITSPVPWGKDIGGSDFGYRGNYSGLAGEWDHAIAIHPTNPKLFVVGQDRMFLTRDSGSTWIPVEAGHEDIQSLAFSNDGAVLYVANDGGVYRLSVPALELKSLNRGLATMQFYRVGVQGNVAVGNADHQGLRGTTDLDSTVPKWERANDGDSGYGRNGLENNFVTADPKTKGRFFVTYGDDLLRLRYPSTGSLEDLLAFNPPAVALNPFTLRSDQPELFNRLNYAVNTLAVDPRVESNTILVSAFETKNKRFGIYVTHDGSADPTGGPRAVCGDATLGDEGWTTRRVGDSVVWEAFECTEATEGTVFYGAPVENTATWTATSVTGLTVPVVSIVFSPHHAGEALALDESGHVWRKEEVNDDLTDWVGLGNWVLAADDRARQIITDPESPLRLYAVSHHGFARSEDGGESWVAAGAATLPGDQQINSICSDPDHADVLYLATSRDVLRTDDRGDTWRSIGRYLPNAPVMHVFTSGGYLYAVTFGRGLWRMRLSGWFCWPC